MQRIPLTVLCIGAGLVSVAASSASVQALPSEAPASSELPGGMPPVAYETEGELPAPEAWPFPERFPRTSGTARFQGGAFYWTDFLYDDTGAAGLLTESASPRGTVHPLGGPVGTYTYGSPEAYRNGADIFRLGIGLHEDSTYWRVDWTTLEDPNIPIVAFALDTDADTSTGMTVLPAGIEARAPGTDHILLMSSQGAWLSDGMEMTRLDQEHDYHVDLATQSFVLRLGSSVLEPDGVWTVRAVSGVADGSGSRFATVGLENGALPGQPNVYNTSFRTVAQENSARYANAYLEATQARTLATGSIELFSYDLDWNDLAERVSTPEPMVRGFSSRWFVSSLAVGPGLVPIEDGVDFTLVPFQGALQPYGIYMPESYHPQQPAPLTWMLHSSGMSHTQFAFHSPRFVRAACEERGAICVSPLGRDPMSWWMKEGELDVWEVWNRVASSFALDHDQVSVTGASMGGYGTYHLALNYPHLFHAAAALAPPSDCASIEFVPDTLALQISTIVDDEDGTCLESGQTRQLVGNAHAVPFYIAHGGVDEVLPPQSVMATVQRFDDLGYRYRHDFHALEGHLLYILLRDGFDAAAAHLDAPPRPPQPASLDYTWYGNAFKEDLGVGPSGAWWAQELRARDRSPGALASIQARSHALPDHEPRVRRSSTLALDARPSPAVVTELRWRPGVITEPTSSRLDADLTNVAEATFDLAAAGLETSGEGHLVVSTDGPLELHLIGLDVDGLVWTSDSTPVTTGGRTSFALGAGDHQLNYTHAR